MVVVVIPIVVAVIAVWVVTVSVLDAAAKPLQIPVYDEAGNVIETHEHKGDFKER